MKEFDVHLNIFTGGFYQISADSKEEAAEIVKQMILKDPQVLIDLVQSSLDQDALEYNIGDVLEIGEDI